MLDTKSLLYNLATACGTGLGVYGIVNGVKDLSEEKADQQDTIFIGLKVLSNAVTCYSLIASGTTRERVTYLLYLITGSIALILSLLALTKDKTEEKTWEERKEGKDSIYSLITVVAVGAAFLSWRLGSALHSDHTSSSPTKSKGKEKTSPLYWVGLALGIVWLGTGIWSGVKNVSGKKPDMSLTILLVISIAASFLRVPLLLSDSSTQRERIRFFFFVLLEGLGLFLNIYAFETAAAYAAASIAILAVVIVEILLFRKMGAGNLLADLVKTKGTLKAA